MIHLKVPKTKPCSTSTPPKGRAPTCDPTQTLTLSLTPPPRSGTLSPRARNPLSPRARNGAPLKKKRSYRDMLVRIYSSVLMLAGFYGVLYMGHVYVSAFVICLQVLMVRELFALAAAKASERELPGFRLLNWWFFAVALFFTYGRFLSRQLTNTITSDKFLSRLFASSMRRHAMYSYLGYISGFVLFILGLKKRQYKYQFGQFAWTHMILFVVFVQSSFVVANIFEGLFWFLMPCALIIVNDCMAYFSGFFFGRTPLIKLSPKKTWEGFIGGSICTLLFGFFVSGYLGHYQWLVCPRADLTTGWLHCEPGSLFTPTDYPLPVWLAAWSPSKTLRAMPVQFHVLVMSAFASIIAPFGGFFASGFKRAFKIKDFGHSIPGHGGITDRMDCQCVMAVFAYIYYSTVIARDASSVDAIIRKIPTLLPEEQLLIYQKLARLLAGEGLIPDSQVDCHMEAIDPVVPII
eukprot:jgi/Mesvir1/7060/Mv09176-RA.1